MRNLLEQALDKVVAKEFIKQESTEVATGETEGYGFTPDEKETIEQAYTVLTKLIILGNELNNDDLVVAAQNLQDVVDEL